MITKLTGRTLTAADFGMPCFEIFEARGLSFAGAGVDATRVRLAAAVASNGFGAWDARRIERPLSASVAPITALAGGYGDAAGAGAGSEKHSASLQHQSQKQQKVAGTAITMRAFRGPHPWIERT
ncbi:hypothetical protein [Streptacidiphilus sp. MAP12-20]|uniref:hypothetical protein n=1 Tax=Streptacidiphilus sp. MAP12-20 TaxID=3156299 RepID=UPI003516EB04